MDQTDFLDSLYKTVPARQRQWHIDNNLFSPVKCHFCNSAIVNWSVKNKRYSKYCSSKCAHSCNEVKDKTAATCLAVYGAKTNLSTDKNKQKAKDTCIQKYGVDNFAKTDKFKKQFKETSIIRYGVPNPSMLETTKDKINETNLAKYGRKRFSQVHIPIDVINLKNNHNEMKRLFFDLKMPVSEIADLLGVNHSQLCVHFKQNLGIDISRHTVSSVERQIFEYVSSITPNVIQSDRSVIKPKELDILIPSKSLAFEINGLAWHTELRGKDKQYHVNKTRQCADAGIRLVHIFDIEWNRNRELVKSRISGLLGKNDTIFARKCKIVELDFVSSTKFFENTHIQGSCVSKITYGLEYNGTIVCAMSFGRPRFSKKYQWELIRFSNNLYTSVVGGASRLLKHFIRMHNPASIVSYCDLRWNTGNIYKTLGFTLVNQTDPNYWYTHNYLTLEHRMQYQKHKLHKKLNVVNLHLTEWENMVNNGYDRVWDCGNLVFELIF